jgi:small nuclear ribonucleoprotein (snRNP)-like protein
MNKLMPVLLMLALILFPVPRALAQELTDPSVVKVKTDIARRLRDAKTNVTVRLRNGSELKGRITQAAESMFTLKEKNTRTQRDISYADVTKVKGQGLSKGAKFGILTGIIAGAVIIGALISLKNFDPFENGVLR